MTLGLLLSKCFLFVQHFKYIHQEVDRQQQVQFATTVGEIGQHGRFVEAHCNHPQPRFAFRPGNNGWLTPRSFQKLCQQMAEGNHELNTFSTANLEN